MTEEMVQVQNWTDEQKSEAKAIQDRMTTTLDEIQVAQDSLEKNFVQLGSDLVSVQKNKFWILYGDFRSYNAWQQSIEPRVKKGRSQLYALKTIAETLLPYAGEEDLIEMGVSKASALAQAVKNSGGKAPADALLKDAKNPKNTVEDLSAKIAEAYGVRQLEDKGVYFNLHGVFFEESEKAEFLRAVEVACKTDPPLPYVITKWEDASAPQKKEVLWRWYASYLAEKETEVRQGIA